MPTPRKKVAKKVAKKVPAPLRRKPKSGPSRADLARQQEQFEALEELAVTIDTARQQVKTINEGVKNGQTEALVLIDSLGVEEHIFTRDGQRYKIQRIQTSSDIIDEPALEKALGSDLWDQVTTRMLDAQKLKAFINSGEVDPKVVQRCSTKKTNNPFVKVS